MECIRPNNQYAHIVGNGDDEDNRSNAHTLDWNGNAWFAGDVKCTTEEGLEISIRALLLRIEELESKLGV